MDKSTTITTFETNCYGYGPTSGGGRIFDKPTRSVKGPRKRGAQAKARRALKATYRRMFRKAEDAPGFKTWARKQTRKAAA